MKLSGLIFLPALLLAFGLGGCAGLKAPVRTYDGAERAATQQAVLDVPELVQVMAVDGHEQSGSLLGARKLKMELLPGEHVLSIRYVGLFADPHMDDHEMVRSRPVALRFTALAGQQYQFRFQQPKDIDSAHAFAKAPVFELLDPTGGVVAKSAELMSYSEASLLDTIGKSFHGDDKPAPASATNLDLLKDVWGRSSPEERAAFKTWLEQGGKP